jgi:hypothetical protein
VEIGTGARWQARSRPKIGDVTWDRTVTYTLRELTDSTATVDADILMTASSQAISVEPRATTTLTSGRNHLGMELIVPLHRLVPAGSLQSTTELNISLVQRALRVTTTLGIDLQLAVKALRDHE